MDKQLKMILENQIVIMKALSDHMHGMAILESMRSDELREKCKETEQYLEEN